MPFYHGLVTFNNRQSTSVLGIITFPHLKNPNHFVYILTF